MRTVKGLYLRNTGFIMELPNKHQGQSSYLEAILMNTISDIRLANARTIAAEYKNPAEFARTIDRESTQVSRFMGANPTKKIGDRMARHIESSCRKPKGWLDTDRISEKHYQAPEYKIITKLPTGVPVVDWSQLIGPSAPDFPYPFNLIATGIEKETPYIPCPTDHGDHTFATRVKDNTMTSQYGRSYPEGSIIFIDPDRANEAQSGDRVLAMIEGTIPTFKQYGEADGERYLQSINLQYPIITREFEITGLVIGMWMPED
jgi:SOS-response transcriptional repressor LexA